MKILIDTSFSYILDGDTIHLKKIWKSQEILNLFCSCPAGSGCCLRILSPIASHDGGLVPSGFLVPRIEQFHPFSLSSASLLQFSIMLRFLKPCVLLLILFSIPCFIYSILPILSFATFLSFSFINFLSWTFFIFYFLGEVIINSILILLI